jgi:hypothetical protein
MIDFAVYQTAQRLTTDLARQALPDAPVRPTPVATRRHVRLTPARQRISLLLRGLADRIDPARVGREPTAVGC